MENFEPDGLLDDDERAARKRDRRSTLEVYRGILITPRQLAAVRRGVLRALSWTNNREQAMWFARRFAEAWPKKIPVLICGKVRMKNAIGPLLGRKEDEYIVPDSTHVKITDVLEINPPAPLPK